MADNSNRPLLLSIVELGGYQNLTPLYQRAGYEVVTAPSVRKALGILKKNTPALVVAEFNYQSDFRDRTSSLESLLAAVQRHPEIRVIVLYDPEFEHQLAKLRSIYPFIVPVSFPVDESRLRELIAR